VSDLLRRGISADVAQAKSREIEERPRAVVYVDEEGRASCEHCGQFFNPSARSWFLNKARGRWEHRCLLGGR